MTGLVTYIIEGLNDPNLLPVPSSASTTTSCNVWQVHSRSREEKKIEKVSRLHSLKLTVRP